MSLLDNHNRVCRSLTSDSYEDDILEWSIENDPYYKECNPEEYDWTHCENVANYIAYLWASKDVKPNEYIQSSWLNLSKSLGVFIVNIAVQSEERFFVIWITNDKIYLYQGYGGDFYATVFQEDKKEWFDDIIRFDELYTDAKSRQNTIYHKLFRLKNAAYSGKVYPFRQDIFYQRVF